MRLKGDTYRVFLVGDSSIWGFLQKPEQTLAGLLESSLAATDIEVFNLGYPSISVLKDLQIIDFAMRYDPDLIIWFTTLEALPREKQLAIPINQNNPDKINHLIDQYSLGTISKLEKQWVNQTFWGQRRNIFDVIQLQLMGFLWDATGIDQEYPKNYRAAQRDFPDPIEEYAGIKILQN